MDLQDQADEFISQLRARCAAGPASGPALVGARATPEGLAVIVYREAPTAPLLGRTYDIRAYEGLFSPDASARYLADVAYADDLCDPSGPGLALAVDWADGLVADAGSIRWLVSDDQGRELGPTD